MKGFRKQVFFLILILFFCVAMALALVSQQKEGVHALSRHEDNSDSFEKSEFFGEQYESRASGHTLDDIRNILSQEDVIGGRRVYNPVSGPKTYPFPTKNLLREIDELVSMDTIQALSSSGPREPIPLIVSTRPYHQRIVVVLMGDGFAENEQGAWPNPVHNTFLYSAFEVANTIISRYPFNLFVPYFQIYAVPIISTQSGIRVGASPYSGTYLGTHLRQEWDLRINRTSRALQISSSVSSRTIMTQIIANTRLGGGVAYWVRASYGNINTVGVSTRFVNHVIQGWNRPAYHSIVIHEIGHNFGQLVDEHETGFGNPNNRSHANMARATDSNEQLRWGHWIGHAGIVRRDNNAPSGYIFPSTNNACKMQGWRATFCAVCRAELVRRMAIVTGETFLSGRLPNGDVRRTTTDVVMNADTTRILPYAFHGNTTIQHVTVPSTVTSIGQFAFLGATRLRTIKLLSPEPPQIASTSFAGVPNTMGVTLRVPRGSRQLFMATVWGRLFTITEHNYTHWHQPEWNSDRNALGSVSGSEIAVGEAWHAFDGNPNTRVERGSQSNNFNYAHVTLNLNENIVVQRVEVVLRARESGSSLITSQGAWFDVRLNNGSYDMVRVTRDNTRRTIGQNFNNQSANNINVRLRVRGARLYLYQIRIIALQPIPVGMEVWRQPTWQTPTNTYGAITSHPAHNPCVAGVRAFDRNPNTYYSAENRFGEVRLNLSHDINLQRIEVIASARNNPGGGNGAIMQIYLDGYNRGTGGATFTIPRRNDNVVERHSFVFYSRVPLARRIQVRMLATNALIRVHEVNITAFVPSDGREFWTQPSWISRDTTSCGVNHGTISERRTTQWGIGGAFSAPFREDVSRYNYAVMPTYLYLNLNYNINVHAIYISARMVRNGAGNVTGALSARVGNHQAPRRILPYGGSAQLYRFEFYGLRTNTIRIDYIPLSFSRVIVNEVRIVASRA